MRADSKPQPPSPRRRPGKAAAGRPPFFGFNERMETWLAVREYCARHECSVNKACQELTLRFLVMGRSDPARNYEIRRETLRDRYYEAEEYLKAERREREEFIRSLRACGASSSQEHEPLPITTYWQGLLADRLGSC